MFIQQKGIGWPRVSHGFRPSPRFFDDPNRVSCAGLDADLKVPALVAVMIAGAVSIDALDTDIADLEAQIEAQIAPFAPAVSRLDEIPGVGATAAAVIIAEVGLDMTRFPTPDPPFFLGPLRPRGQRVRRP